MSTIRTIRDHLGLRQWQLADIAGVTQATVSRWESGELRPDMGEMARIRNYAKERGFEWDDAMFFDRNEAAE